MKHGVRGWEDHNCRCEVCEVAIKAKRARWRERLKARKAGVELPPTRRGPEPGPRLPILPLFLAAARRCRVDGSMVHSAFAAQVIGERGGMTVAELADYIGVQPDTVTHWLAEGGIPLYSADAAAVELRLHPVAIWPDWFDLADVNIEQEAVTAAAEAEVVRRRAAIDAMFAIIVKSHCVNGHRLTADNIYRRRAGERSRHALVECRICRKATRDASRAAVAS